MTTMMMVRCVMVHCVVVFLTVPPQNIVIRQDKRHGTQATRPSRDQNGGGFRIYGIFPDGDGCEICFPCAQKRNDSRARKGAEKCKNDKSNKLFWAVFLTVFSLGYAVIQSKNLGRSEFGKLNSIPRTINRFCYYKVCEVLQSMKKRCADTVDKFKMHVMFSFREDMPKMMNKTRQFFLTKSDLHRYKNRATNSVATF